MKKIGLFLMMFILMTSLVYAHPARSIVDGDNDALDINSDGSIDVSQDGFSITPQTKTHEAHNTIETDTEVWAPASGNKIVLMGVMYWADTLGHFFVESNSTKVIPTSGISVASGVTVIDGGYPIWQGAVDATLTYTTAVDCDHSILMWGFEK